MQELVSRLVAFVQSNKLVSILSGLGVVFLLWSFFSFGNAPADDAVQFTNASSPKTTLQPQRSGGGKELYVDVAGAVKNPGVYLLHANNRVKDAILAAGGFSEHADRLRIARSVNLAALLTDGAKLYIPTVGEAVMTSSGGNTNASGGVLSAQSPQININEANAADLDNLPGIGKVTADKIIANRPYNALTELVDKKVISASLFAKIKDKITLY